MCSINGFNFDNKELIKRMNAVTKHRGPDGTGVFLDEQISLGHNRLSIIDLSKAADQPMISNDQKMVIIFNGEIYNFRELKNELASGYNFHTQSDTEVILAAYQKWGPECVKRFNGIFTFAIWDKTKRELLLARDQIGVKPLYYYQDDKKFIFSSEIKAVLEHDIKRELDMDAFNIYLKIFYVPAPLTMFRNIYKFPPAHYAIIKENKIKFFRYWQDNVQKQKIGKKEAAETLKEKINRAVDRQLISDRPVGVYLSGGIDSSTVLHNMSGLRNRKIDTFSVGFHLEDGEEREKFNADFYLARQTAEHYETNHNELMVDSNEVVSNFEQAVWHMDEPISVPTAISMFILAKYAKRKVDVVLGGDGGDELFGGYRRYQLSYLSSQYRRIPRPFRKLLDKTPFKKLDTKPGIERYRQFWFFKLNLAEVIDENFIRPEIANEFFTNSYFQNLNRPFEEIFMETDRKVWLVDESLTLSDKMTMSAGLEERVPLLDIDLVEFANTLPVKLKVNMFNKKILLKEAVKDQLPPFLLQQKKRGWTSPGAKWLRHENLNRFAKVAFQADYYSGTKSLIKWQNLNKILDDHCSKKKYNLHIIWALLTFQVWAKTYKITLS